MVKPTVDITQIVGITSPADFYAWKKHIVEAVKQTNLDFGRELENNTSVLVFYQQKDAILTELGLNGGE